MRRLALLLTVIVAPLILIFGSIALLTAGASGGSTASSVFGRAQFLETEFGHITGAETESWQVRVYTRQGRFAGSGVISCAPISAVASLQQCSGTYLLPRGRVAVQGLITSRAAYNLIIVGGTDAYIGAKGSLVVIRTQQAPRKAQLTFVFR